MRLAALLTIGLLLVPAAAFADEPAVDDSPNEETTELGEVRPAVDLDHLCASGPDVGTDEYFDSEGGHWWEQCVDAEHPSDSEDLEHLCASGPDVGTDEYFDSEGGHWWEQCVAAEDTPAEQAPERSEAAPREETSPDEPEEVAQPTQVAAGSGGQRADSALPRTGPARVLLLGSLGAALFAAGSASLLWGPARRR